MSFASSAMSSFSARIGVPETAASTPTLTLAMATTTVYVTQPLSTVVLLPPIQLTRSSGSTAGSDITTSNIPKDATKSSPTEIKTNGRNDNGAGHPGTYPTASSSLDQPTNRTSTAYTTTNATIVHHTNTTSSHATADISTPLSSLLTSSSPLVLTAPITTNVLGSQSTDYSNMIGSSVITMAIGSTLAEASTTTAAWASTTSSASASTHTAANAASTSTSGAVKGWQLALCAMLAVSVFIS